MIAQRGGFAMGLVTGLLIGLALALAVALYITKAPVPFVNKVPQRTAEQDSAETERNRNWDPNAGLAGRTAARAASATAAGAAAAAASAAGLPLPGAAVGPASLPPQPPATAASRPQARDPAAILSGKPGNPGDEAPRSTTSAAEPFIYFVQAGAYTRNEDAEQQRARLAMIGQAARITEREQAGRTVYRVRLGPLPSRSEAEGLQQRLQEQGIEAQIVRVEKS